LIKNSQPFAKKNFKNPQGFFLTHTVLLDRPAI